MKRAPSVARPDTPTEVIDRFLGTAYDNVLLVAQNMPTLLALNESVETIEETVVQLGPLLPLAGVMENMAVNTFLGRVDPVEEGVAVLTPAQVRTALNVADGATANATDASLRDRSTHTGTQAISTITGLQSALDGKLGTGASIPWTNLTGVPVTFTPSGHSHFMADVAGLLDRFDDVDTIVSGAFFASNTRALLQSLEIKTGRFAGAWRHRDVGPIRWYFTFSAMVLAKKAFTNVQRRAGVEAAINRGLVSPRANTGTYNQFTFVTFPSGKVFFCNSGTTTSGSVPSDAAATVAGNVVYESSVGSGDIIWEYTGLQVPTSWQYFLVDIQANLLTPYSPDSHDAYAGMLLAAVKEAGVTAAWLNVVTGHNGLTRRQILELVMQHNCTDQLNGTSPGPRLARTFQGGVDVNGDAYGYRFNADNSEVHRGFVALAHLQNLAGVSNTAALQNAADVKAGVLGLMVSGRFQTYEGQSPAHLSLGGNEDLITDLRFHISAALHGLLEGVSEMATYGDAVVAYIRAAVPGLLTDVLDEAGNAFPMGELYVALADKFHWPEAEIILRKRVTSRLTVNVTIMDAALVLRHDEDLASPLAQEVDGLEDFINSTVADGDSLTASDIGTTVQAYDPDTAKTDVAQSFSKAQGSTPVALTDGANIATDASLSNVFTVTLGGNRTLDNPTNLVAGRVYTWIISQDGTGGHTLAFGSNFDFPGGVAPTIANGISDVSIVTGIAMTTSRLLCVANLDFS